MVREKSGFWDSIEATATTPADERTYDSREMTMPMRLLLSNGVDVEPDALKVSPGAYERSSQIAPGYAWIRGRWYELKDDGTGGAQTLTLLHDAPVQYNRIDRVILRYDENYTLDGQFIRAIVLKGMEAEVPTAPELTDLDEITEKSLAQVLVTPSQLYFLPEDIVNERDNEAVCGRVRLRPGTDVTAHAARHAADGSDPIKVGATANKAVYTGTGGTLQAGTLPVAAGGTGANNATNARTNLGAAAATQEITGTLTAAGWTGASAPYTQTITMDGVLAASKGKLSLAQGATVEQRKAARKAKIDVSAQADGTVTVIADGEKPAIDLPVVLHIWG